MLKILVFVLMILSGISGQVFAYCGNGIVENNGLPVRTWVGQFSDKASNPTNWLDGIRPIFGETARISGNVPVDWDYDIELGALDFFQYSGTVTITANVTISGDSAASETCDDGNMDNYDGCTNDCIAEYHGDGIVQLYLGEECDDGNGNLLDGCTPDGQLRYDCVDGKDCRVVYIAGTEICNAGDPRITQYIPVSGGVITADILSSIGYIDHYNPPARVIFCSGNYYMPPITHIYIVESDWVGYDPPVIPNISYKHPDYMGSYTYPPYILGKLWDGYGLNPQGFTWNIQPTDTVFRPQGANQNVLTMARFTTNNGWNYNQFVAGIVFTGARGTACLHNAQTCDDAAGMRAYCTRGAKLENNIFYDNVVGALVKDTDPRWMFEYAFVHNFFYRNTMDGLRWNYGDGNLAMYNTFVWNYDTNLRIRDGSAHLVFENNFGWSGKYQVRLEAVMYPANVANLGTRIEYNNFIGSCYSPVWNSFFDSCPTCGHWYQNFYKFGRATNQCAVENDLDSAPTDVEWDMLLDYIGC